MTYLQVMPSWVEDVVREDEVSAKTALLERKKDSVDEVVLHMAVPLCL